MRCFYINLGGLSEGKTAQAKRGRESYSDPMGIKQLPRPGFRQVFWGHRWKRGLVEAATVQANHFIVIFVIGPDHQSWITAAVQIRFDIVVVPTV